MLLSEYETDGSTSGLSIIVLFFMGSLFMRSGINIILAIDIILWCAFHLWISAIIRKNGNKLEPANKAI